MRKVKQDEYARERALTVDESFIVQAPAGSGKTELLTQRLLALLGIVKKPEQVLAMTFTRKAAFEMRARVLSALEKADNQPEPLEAYAKTTYQLAKQVLQKNQTLDWQLFENPGRLNITTIDGLCQSIFQRAPVLSQMGAGVRVTDVPQKIYQETVEQFLSEALQTTPEWAQQVYVLIRYFDNRVDTLGQLLMAMLAEREQWLDVIYAVRSKEVAYQSLIEALEVLREDWWQSVMAYLQQHALFEVKGMLVDTFQYAMNNLGQSVHELSKVDLWCALCHWLLTEKGQLRKRFTVQQGMPAKSFFKNKSEQATLTQYKQKLDELLVCLSEAPGLLALLVKGKQLPLVEYSTSGWQMVEALVAVLPILLAYLHIHMSQAQAVDFVEIALKALDILGAEEAPSEQALLFDAQISHILVDEFQDTSQLQYRLLEKLCAGWQSGDGRTLFLVGDPMQSIYRFRQADVGLFLQVAQYGIKTVQLEYLQLSRNFRSDRQLIEWFNLHFAKIMPNYEDALTGAIAYKPSTPTQEMQDAKAPSWHFFENEQLEAGFISQQILDWQKTYPQDSIAILVRSRAQLSTLLPVLRYHEIAFMAHDIEALYDQPVIEDLLMLLKASLNLADEVALAAVLRAPWCGLTLSDFTLLVSGRKDGSLLYEVLKQFVSTPSLFKKLSAHGQFALKCFMANFEKALQSVGLLPVRQWLETFWLALNGPACLEKAVELEFTETFFNVLDEFDTHVDVETLVLKLKALKAPVEPKSHAVEVMTIHKSKGLEFDRVFVLGLAQGGGPHKQALLLWQRFLTREGAPHLLLSPLAATGEDADSLYTFIKNQHQLQAAFEQQRLLYVALTRAKKALVLSAVVGEMEDQTFKAKKQSFLALFQEVNLLPDVCIELVFEKVTVAQPLALNHRADNLLKHLPDCKRMTLPDFEKGFGVSKECLENELNFDLENQVAQATGTILHLLLQMLAESEDLPLNFEEYWHKWQPYIKRKLMQKGVPEHCMSSCCARLQRALKNMLNTENGRWCLTAYPQGKCEFEMLSKETSEVLICDRTFVFDNVRWILDYKLSEPLQGEALSAFSKRMKMLYQAQINSYKRAMKYQPFDSPVKAALVFPLIWENNRVHVIYC